MHCRLCGGKYLTILHPYKGFDIEKCDDCGLVQVSVEPTPAELDQLYGEAFFKKGKYVQDEAINREQQRRVRLMLDAGLKTGSRILDVGCATGDFLVVAQENFDVWGQDISLYAIETAQKIHPSLSERLRSGPIEQLDYEQGSFDAITLWDVVEHLWDPVNTIKKAMHWLKPGGYLFVSSPDIGAGTAKVMGRYWAFMTPPEHLVFFDHKTWGRLLDEVGLVEQSFTSKGKWVNTGFLFYKLNRVMPMIMPTWLLSKLSGSFLARTTVYVPTGDILYTAAQLPASRATKSDISASHETRE